jgi:glycosyltransferase involved in cell wall biosynthesis
LRKEERKLLSKYVSFLRLHLLIFTNGKTIISEMLTFIIIPIYNESKVIYKLLQNEEFKKYVLILVDDGSKDDLSLRRISIPFYFLQHSKNLGQGAALQTGMEFAKLLDADIVVHFDGDGQHDPADIERLTEPVIAGKASVVIGSRFLKSQGETNLSKIPYPRKIILQCARLIQFIYTGMRLTDSQNGLRAISGAALGSIEITENRMAHAIELIQIFQNKKLHVTEVPVHILYTEYSNVKGQKLLNGVFIVLKLLINKLVKNIRFSAVFIALVVGTATWVLTKKENLLYASVSAVFIYFFILVCLLIIRKIKQRSVSATQIIRADTIQKVKKFNSPSPG